MLHGASTRSKRLRESPSLHSNKPVVAATDQAGPSRKEKPSAACPGAAAAWDSFSYYPGTAIPREGWFHACRLCRSWTAFAAESSNGTVPLCRRCAVQSAADVFPVQVDSDTNSAAAPEPLLGPAPAAAALQQAWSPVIPAPAFTSRAHPQQDISSSSACGLDRAAYQLLQQCQALKTTGNEAASGAQATDSIVAGGSSAGHSSYHRQLLSAATSTMGSTGFAASPETSLLLLQRRHQLQQRHHQLQQQQQQLQEQLQLQLQQLQQRFLASMQAAPLAAPGAGSSTLDAIASLLGRWRNATAAAPQQASAAAHHLTLAAQQLAVEQQVSSDLQQLQQQHMPASHSQRQQQ